MSIFFNDVKFFRQALALFCLCGLILIEPSHCVASDMQVLDQDTQFPVEGMKQDVDFLVNTLCDVHFSLSGAESQVAELHLAAEQIKGILTKPLTQGQLFVCLAPLVTGLEDGHTQIYLPAQSIEAYKQNNGTVIPVDITILDDRVYVLRCYAADSNLKAGAELLAINRVPMREIIRQMVPFLSGERENFRYVWLQGKGNDYFKVLLWLSHGFSDTFDIRYQQDGIIGEIQLQGLDSPTLHNLRQNTSPASFPLNYQSLEKNIGLLALKTFRTPSAEFRSFLNKTFKQIRRDGIEYLIIDIRGNLGGTSDQAGELLSYLTATSINVTPVVQVRVSSQAKEQFKQRIPGLVRWLPVQNLSSRGRAVWNATEGSVVSFKEKAIKPKAKQRRYHGKVYLLIDEGTFSTAAILADAMNRHGIGVLIGRETGGLAGSTWGEPLFFETPNCHIRFSVSSMQLHQGEEILNVNREGVVPHFVVAREQSDSIQETDAVLEKAKALIASEIAQKEMK